MTAVTDLAVGAFRDDTGGSGRGAVHVLFMNTNGTAKSTQKIASGTSGGPTLAERRLFRPLGGLARRSGWRRRDATWPSAPTSDDTGGSGRGALHVLFLNTNGTVKSSKKIAQCDGRRADACRTMIALAVQWQRSAIWTATG